MSMIEVEGLKVNQLENGFILSYNDGIHLNVCGITVDEDGKVECSEGAIPSAKIGDSNLWNERFTVQDQRKSMPWAFALMGVGSSEAVMDKLRIPLETRHQIRSSFEGLIETVRSALVPKVDQRGLLAISKATVKTVSALNFYSGDSERASIRRQAAASYPILADHMASNLTAKMAIDRSKPLEKVITSLLSNIVDGEASKAVLKRLAQADEIPDGAAYENVIRFMTMVPPDWIPASGNEWEAFCAVAQGLLSDLACLEHQVPDLVKGCGGKWEDLCARVVKKAGIAEPDVKIGFRYVMANTSEIIDAFSDVGVLPMAAHAGIANMIMVTPEMRVKARETSLAMLIGGRNLADLADTQRRWHQSRNSILGVTAIIEAEKRAALKDSVEQGSWPGLTRKVQAPNGLWLVPLTDPEQLLHEGSVMNHCVGGYSGNASKCRCFIVSVREISPETGTEYSLSTAEIRELQDHSDTLTVQQHRSVGNGSPSPRAQDAFNWYLSAIRAGVVPLQRELINAFIDKEHVPDDGVERLSGFDWRDPDTLNLAISPWGPFVVSPFKSYGLQALLDCDEVRDITDLIAPEIMANMR